MNLNEQQAQTEGGAESDRANHRASCVPQLKTRCFSDATFEPNPHSQAHYKDTGMQFPGLH